MKTNYLLIDYENVQPTKLAALNTEQWRVIIFVGAHQPKISFDLVAALQPWGARAEYIKIASSGPNALDFHIAYYIGQLAAREPDAYFHIISKDVGFDPLVAHLKTQQIRASRSGDVTDIPLVKAGTVTSDAERVAVIIADLQRRGSAKPRTVKTLSGTINALFQKRLTEAEAARLIAALQAQGVLRVKDDKVMY